jgi:hypothetical protein
LLHPGRTRITMAAMERQVPHDLHLLPTAKSALEARAVLEDKVLNPQITTLSIRASLEDVDSEIHTTWDVPSWASTDPAYGEGVEHGIEKNGVLSPTFKAMLNDIGLFRNLRRLELTHDHQAEASDLASGHAREWTEYREAFFNALILALNHPDHPAEHLRNLSIINLQDVTNYDLVKSPDFKTVISRLDSLELCVVTEEHDAAPELEIEFVERHIFFGRDLRQYWLEPLQGKLINLKIYSNCPWGYLPKCDLRGLHFPLLKSLSLGNMTFTHDWQLDWIISHDTLELLTLDDCPIIHDAMMSGACDSERYIPLDDIEKGLLRQGNSRKKPKQTHWHYEARWHVYFRRLKNGLPNLERFGVDRGPWNPAYEEDHASEPFKAAASLPARLAASRYMIFHSGTGPCPWIEPEGCSNDEHEKVTVLENQYDSCWDEEGPIPPPLYPDCWDEDQKALDELLAVVKSRTPKDEAPEKQNLKRSSDTAGFAGDDGPSQGRREIG